MTDPQAQHRDLAWGSLRVQDTAIPYPISKIKPGVALGPGPGASIQSQKADGSCCEPNIMEHLSNFRLTVSWTFKKGTQCWKPQLYTCFCKFLACPQLGIQLPSCRSHFIDCGEGEGGRTWTVGEPGILRHKEL